MSDRFNDVLAAIDAETAKCICGRTVPADGPSLDYCSLPCQYRYAASLVGTTPDYENQYQADDEITDGREIVAEVARELARPAPYGAAEFHSGDAMRQRLSDEEGDQRSTPQSALAEMVRVAYGIPESMARFFEPAEVLHIAPAPSGEMGPYIVDHGGYAVTESPEAFAAAHAEFRSSEALRRTYTWESTDDDRGASDHNPPATARDVTAPAWIDISRFVVSMDAVRDAAGRLSVAAQGAASSFGVFFAPQQLTGDEFRRRALEHRQNRGTGPKPGRRIPPRDLRR